MTGGETTLNGSVNPGGNSTDTFLQYSTDPTLPANVVTTLAGSPGHYGSAMAPAVPPGSICRKGLRWTAWATSTCRTR